MKILFICGSLEPGRDGVGDYTRRLSGELIRQGHKVRMIALNDKYLTGESWDALQYDEKEAIHVLRLSKELKWQQRINQAKKWTDDFNPDWISLQFVPFAFEKRGLSLLLGTYLRKIGDGRKWHIMFHELWVGMEEDAVYKLKVWGIAQRGLIKYLLNTLKPAVVHTHAHLYQYQLKTLHVNAAILPLFGGITHNLVSKQLTPEPDNSLKVVVFGGIHYGAPIEIFLKEVINYSKKYYDKVNLSFIGHNGKYLEDWVNSCKKEGIHVDVLGEQSTDKISELLQESTLGVSTTPFLLAEKSSTIASMNEHGLPVLCVARSWNCKGFSLAKSTKHIAEYYPGYFFSEPEFYIKKITHTYSVNTAAGNLLKSLALIK